jgi:hypothetical protein
MRLYTNQRFVENIGFHATLGYVIDREELLGGSMITHMRKTLA